MGDGMVQSGGHSDKHGWYRRHGYYPFILLTLLLFNALTNLTLWGGSPGILVKQYLMLKFMTARLKSLILPKYKLWL